MSLPKEHACSLPPLFLAALPNEMLFNIVVQLDPFTVLQGLGSSCFALYQVLASDELWQAMFQARFRVVIDSAFFGICPLPSPNRSWRAHFFDFAHNWMLQAKASLRAGDGELSSPTSGRAIVRIWGHVYDVSDYVDDHPGLPAFLLSAAGTDATAVFKLAGHSDNARHILHRFAAPHLDVFWPSRRQLAPLGGEPRRRDSPSEHKSGEHHLPPAWKRALCALCLLLGSRRGRGALLDAAMDLLHAVVVDLERTGRDPHMVSAPWRTGGIQRFVPVVWRLACDELSATARALSQPIEARTISRTPTACCLVRAKQHHVLATPGSGHTCV